MKLCWILIFGLATGWAQAAAESSIPQYDKYIKSTESIGVVGKELAGDVTNLYTGSTSFSNVDLSVPGNSALPVQMARRYSIENKHDLSMVRDPAQPQNWGAIEGVRQFAFGNWELDTPRLSTVMSQELGWQVNTTTPLKRCSLIGQVTAGGSPANGSPRHSTTYPGPSLAWSGYTLHTGSDEQSLLLATETATPMPTNGGPYHWVTNQHWRFSCLPTTLNDGGEGFLGISPDGTKYWFNRISRRNIDATYAPYEFRPGNYRTRHTYQSDVFLLATRVEDRFGNYVLYNYSNDTFAKLQNITASDGRQITVSYNGANAIATVSDGVRTLTYSYTGNHLTRVQQPDTQSAWQYDFSQLANMEPQPWYPSPFEEERCREGAAPPGPGDDQHICYGLPMLIGTASAWGIHPSGARVDFVFQMHFQPPVAPNYSAWIFGLKEKRISGPGLAQQTWHYQFAPNRDQGKAQCAAGSCPDRVWTDEIAPDYSITRRLYGIKTNVDQGMLLQELRGYVPTTTTQFPASGARIFNSRRGGDWDVVDDATPVLVTGVTGAPHFFDETDYFYYVSPKIGTNPLPTLQPGAQVLTSERYMPVTERKTTRDNWITTYRAVQWDGFGRATSLVKSSAAAP